MFGFKNLKDDITLGVLELLVVIAALSTAATLQASGIIFATILVIILVSVEIWRRKKR